MVLTSEVLIGALLCDSTPVTRATFPEKVTREVILSHRGSKLNPVVRGGIIRCEQSAKQQSYRNNDLEVLIRLYNCFSQFYVIISPREYLNVYV